MRSLTDIKNEILEMKEKYSELKDSIEEMRIQVKYITSIPDCVEEKNILLDDVETYFDKEFVIDTDVAKVDVVNFGAKIVDDKISITATIAFIIEDFDFDEAEADAEEVEEVLSELLQRVEELEILNDDPISLIPEIFEVEVEVDDEELSLNFELEEADHEDATI